ncbi:MAG TPA: enoyl-CoA hydratase [Caulobacteraceae bacterium]|nr:enoyl-CoA hydratase [Caulobacteraceae bacterium]
MSLVRIAIEGPIARLTLADPARANVLSRAMMTALSEALAEANASPDTRAVVLAAEGRIFCAGHDLSELLAIEGEPEGLALFGQCSELMTSIVRSPRPVIAQVQGAAVAAGCQLVASCDLAFASEGARFAVSGIDLGLFCSTPSVAVSRAIGRKAAMEMLLTGRFIDATEAQRLGLINRAVPAADLERTVAESARTIAAKAAEAIALGKELFNRQLGLDLTAAYGAAGEAMAKNLALACAQAGIKGFLERRGAA